MSTKDQRSTVTGDPMGCGHTLHVGDQAFSVYTMTSGEIGPVDSSGWFDFADAAGKRSLLNGDRVCCLECARRYGHLKDGA